MLKRILGWFGLDPVAKYRATRRIRRGFGGARRPGFEHLEDRRMLATLTVSVDDDGAIATNDGELTLREAIAYVNGDETPGIQDRNNWIDETVDPLYQNDVIKFSTDPNDELDGAIILLDLGELRITADATVDNKVTIDASDLAEYGITISGGHGDDLDPATGDGIRIFNIDNPNKNIDVTLKGLTITGGDVGTDATNYDWGSKGGGILNLEDLTLDNVIRR